MGWSERGKKGIHTGRTLRQSIHYGRWPGYLGNTGISEGVLVKFKNNTFNTPNSEITSLLEDRYGLTDGLDLKFVPHIHDDGVVFSLGKRKRWLLPDLVRERVDEDVPVDDQDENTLHLCFQTRHSNGQLSRTRGDCVSVYSDHDGEIKPKHKYSFYSDIRHKDKDSKPPEVGYEISQPAPSTCWPNFSRENYPPIDYSFRPNGKKSKCKGKGIKNKIRNRTFLCKDDMFDDLYTNQKEHKIQSISQGEFHFAEQQMSTERDTGSLFTFGEFVEERKKQNSRKVKSGKSKDITSGCVKKYGKGCAVYVDGEAKKPQDMTQQSNIKSWKEHQESTVNINIATDEIKVTSLQAEWGDWYSEAATVPRKFAINISSLLPTNKPDTNGIANIIFETLDKTSKDNIAIKLVYAWNNGTNELCQAVQDFASCITKTTCASRIWKVREVILTAVNCIQAFAEQLSNEALSKSQTTSTGKTISVPSLDFLNEVCRCQSKPFTLEEAQHQIRTKINNEAKYTKRIDVDDSHWTLLSVECGICCEQFEDNDYQVTCLTECGHSFCNECWVGHLETQVAQGMEHLKCPGYKCDCKVDNITLMCLAPQLYVKFLNMKVNKHLETSVEWKWCPGKHCSKVVKATAESKDAFTVLCSCQQTWCFKCKKQAHWPASCAESEMFIQKTGYFKNQLEMESKDLISSVMVKNCPQCEYPIEKNHGCQFMWCVLCNVHFCWNCLAITSYGHSCDKEPNNNITEVILNVRNNRYEIQKYLDLILKNKKARQPKLLADKRKKVKALEVGFKSYCAVVSQQVLPHGESDISSVVKVMKDFVRNRIPENVQEAVEFEFQARLALEGFAQKAAMLKSHFGRSARTKMSQLAFVVERIDIMLQEPLLLCKDEQIAWLKRLVEIGKNCVVLLNKKC